MVRLLELLFTRWHQHWQSWAPWRSRLERKWPKCKVFGQSLHPRFSFCEVGHGFCIERFWFHVPRQPCSNGSRFWHLNEKNSLFSDWNIYMTYHRYPWLAWQTFWWHQWLLVPGIWNRYGGYAKYQTWETNLSQFRPESLGIKSTRKTKYSGKDSR